MNRPVSKDRKRVLIVTEAGDVWPGGYTRALIYKDLFLSDGIECEYVSRQVPSLMRLMQRPGRFANRLLESGFKLAMSRLNENLARRREEAIIRKAANGYDAIYLQGVRSGRLAAALHSGRARLVYDLNDRVCRGPRAEFAEEGLDILSMVDSVTCDNPLALEFARSHNGSSFLVPDPPQIEFFDQCRPSITRKSSSLVLGWIGSPATLFNLLAIWEPLEVLFARFGNLSLRLVGTGHNRLLLPRFEKVRYSSLPFYSQDQLIREVLQMDIGLFPLFDVEESWMSGISPATVYMSGEACVLAARIGQVCGLISDGENGMLAGNAKEWLDKMSELVENAALRKRLARAGLETVREKFTVRQCYEKLRSVLLG